MARLRVLFHLRLAGSALTSVGRHDDLDSRAELAGKRRHERMRAECPMREGTVRVRWIVNSGPRCRAAAI